MFTEQLSIQIVQWFFAFVRINALLTFLPFFGDQPIPLRFRTALSAILAIVVIPTISKMHMPAEIRSISGALLLVFGEIIVGVTVGYLSKLCLDAVVAASTLVATQMGFGADKLFIPDYSGELDSFTALHRMIVLLLFLSLNLHYGFLVAILRCFDTVPLFKSRPSLNIVNIFVHSSGEIFQIAIQLSSPILVGILLSTTALGVLSRTVPQLNVFVISYGVNFVLGILVYLATLPMFPDWLTLQFDQTMELVHALMIDLGGRAQ